jgi:hypothetical protein
VASSIHDVCALLALAACSTPPEPVRVQSAPSSPPRVEAPAQDAGVDAEAPDAAIAYDVEADRERRMRAAAEDLGAHAAATKVTTPFVLAGPNRAALTGSEAFIESVLAAYRRGRFDKSPQRAISIYVFPAAAAYHAYCRRVYGGTECMSHFGFYEPEERKIIMQGGAGGTLSHELAHPFYEADFPDGPTWLNEGIASVFEQPILYPKGEIHGGKNWRLPRLIQALSSAKEKDEARLESLFGMADATFRNDQESLHYAIARYACQWLDERGFLWPFYHAYRDDSASDPTGEAAFTKVVGKKPADATREWHRWLRAL